ncbi:MAG: exosortase, partial [Candidatus Zixiibacteriota bacterium]
LILSWYHDANYSHGFLVPIISFYLIWKRRKDLSTMEIKSNRLGLGVIIFGLLLFILGNGASEYFTVRLSLVVILFGIVLYHFGSRIIGKLWFAIFFLIFMIPIPYVIYFSATFPMQLLASKVTAVMLNAIGMPVIRQGNIINLPNQALEVAEACSGMRSLVSLMALSAIYAYLSQRKLAAQIILFFSAIPIAIAGNIFRVFTTSIIVYISDLNITDEPFHSIMGASVFFVAFILLFIFGAVLQRIFR